MSNPRTKSANQSLEHYYNGSLSATKQSVFTGQDGNVYGFEIENNSSTADIFVQIFDKASANVTVGTTVPDYTFRVPAGANFGKDAQGLVLHFHSLGCIIACTSSRTGSGAPSANCSINIWYWNH